MSEIVASPARIGRSAVAALGMLAVAAGSLESVIQPVLPLLQRDLGITPAEGALLSITLLITGAIITPIAGKLGDRYGGKRVLVRLMAVVCLGGLLSAMAPNLPLLLLGQVLQGAMVGALPLSFILVRRHLAPGQSSVAIGIVSGMFLGGNMVGMLLAGPVAEGLSRHWMFALPTIAIMAGTLAVNALLPVDPPSGSLASIDWKGLVYLSGTLLSLMAGLTILPDAGKQPLAVGAIAILTAALAAGWIVVERRATAPMVDLRMLSRPAVWSSCVLTFAICIGSASSLFLVPQLFEASGDGYGFGASATDIGRFLLPGAIAGAVSGPIGGYAARRFGPRAVVIVGTVVVSGTLLAVAGGHGAVWQLVVAKALIALAAGTCVTALVTNVASDVDQNDTGIGTSLVLVARVVGSAVGVGICGAILTAGTRPGSDVPAESAFVTGFVLAGLATAVAVLVLVVNRLFANKKGEPGHDASRSTGGRAYPVER